MTIDSAEEFVALRSSEEPAEYGRAAHDEASLDVWREVISSYPDMRKWVAHNKSVPVEILSDLAEDEDPEVRWAVARKRKLTQELFEVLADDGDESVRLRIALNPEAPPHVLLKLASDGSAAVRRAVEGRRDPLS